MAPHWKPGQSGNPAGGSAKRTRQKYLRDFIRGKMAEQADLAVIKEIIGETVVDLDDMSPVDALAHMRQMIEDGLSKGEVIAHKIVSDAMGTGKDAATARAQIISTEPKTVELVNDTPPLSPNFVPTEAEQAAIEAEAGGEETVH